MLIEREPTSEEPVTDNPGSVELTDGVLTARTLRAVQDEATRAHGKHGQNSLINPFMPTLTKLAALVEEVGEVGRAVTYDEGDRRRLEAELIQVASVAASWWQSMQTEIPEALEEERRERELNTLDARLAAAVRDEPVLSFPDTWKQPTPQLEDQS